MKKIIFENDNEFLVYLNKNKVDEIGRGSEGICYSTKNNQALKVYIDDEDCPSSLIDYDINAIIMDEEVNIKNFIFPTQLIIINNKLKAYYSRKVKKDLLDISKYYTFNLDFDKFIKAYYTFLERTIEISKRNILFYDLPYNLLFDGEDFYGVDTIEYRRVNNPLDTNIASFQTAIEASLNSILTLKNIEEISFDKDKNIENICKKVKTQLEEENSKQYYKTYPYC